MYNEAVTASGFVDLQVNGFGGINFSDGGLSVDQIITVTEMLTQRGTLAFCPTVVTCAPDIYRQVLPQLAKAMDNPECGRHLLGIHLEGPFISPEDGAVGAHPTQYVQVPSIAAFEELYALADGKIAILTLAPERVGALELIRHAVDYGVVVSIGHTLADADVVRAAVDAGARCSTHLGNGCPNFIHRHSNPIWPQLAAPELTTMIITDGHHLPPPVIAAFVAAKGPEQIVVTSDSSPAAGCQPGVYEFFGTRALLEPSGRLCNLERDTLAGSSATMQDCMNTLAALNLLSEADLWRVGRDNPLAILGKTAGDLPEGGNLRFFNGHFE